jgi:hypothetical protein
MKHFVVSEEGTSSTLATLIDPVFARQSVRDTFVKSLCAKLRSEGVKVDETGVKDVRCEYDGMDIVALWGNWLLVFENKVSSQSISPGQLSKYYQRLKRFIHEKRKLFGVHKLSNERIAFVFLTPKDFDGMPEFESFKVDTARGDRKVHLSWESHILPYLKNGLDTDSDDAFHALIEDCLRRTEQILAERQQRGKVEQTPKRAIMKQLLNDVQEYATKIIEHENLGKFSYADTTIEQRYGRIGGSNGNVYVNLHEDNTTVGQEENGIVDFSIQFRVANKAPVSAKDRFEHCSKAYWSTVLHLDEDKIELDIFDHSVRYANQLEYSDHLVKNIGSLYVRFLVAAQSFTRDTNE